MKVNQKADQSGTSLKGYVRIRYGELERALGKPKESDGYKVSGEWILEDEHGQIFTIYDWKATELYDNMYPTVAEFRSFDEPHEFHIGGHVAGHKVVKYLREVTGNTKLRYASASSRWRTR